MQEPNTRQEQELDAGRHGLGVGQELGGEQELDYGWELDGGHM